MAIIMRADAGEARGSLQRGKGSRKLADLKGLGRSEGRILREKKIQMT